MTRSRIIDMLEDYNTEEDYEKLDAAIEQVTGQDPEFLDDSDDNEGMYADISTEDLQEILNILQGKSSRDAKKYTISDLVYEEYALIREAVEMFSDPSFSKSRRDASIAKHIMNKQGW